MLSSHLEKILGRLDDLDSVNLTILVQRLARERELLETVFNTINEGILVISATGLIEYSNHTAKNLIGLKDKDVGSATLWKLVPELAQSMRVQGALLSASVVSREMEIAYPEHRVLRMHMVPFTISTANEEVDTHKFTVILTDITEEKLSTEERIENERVSSIFMLAAGVAHELGNPLNAINIHLSLIKRKLKQLENIPETEKIADSVQVCMSEVERLDGIINHFLNAIRPQNPDLLAVSPLKVLDEVLATQAHELENFGIRVEVELSQEVPYILADKNQLKQVFFNVIKNGMEAMSRGGVLTITPSADNEWVYIRVKDNGSGIGQQDLSKIFQPYFTTKKEGHGLGMMIVQRIMREHGGRIGIDSQEGQGTEVILQFPIKAKRLRMLES
ncbi:MAG: PAS domain-containing sensor histidine kinase [Verrucomicrobia bacterium CG_4_10_14_3_um_filter_43_23]|nr:MAG: PAS domain-containing sensor histidine kinase [Verrucomicrobia bacterium CG1_02_43_26]PIP59418.1 MAG: PAS domain-containing sensor histidine kinase [Verrucomicrobia bacterium CG22_combo_CG10-13_8_21_14_all_43_17]PIX58770.1 MAG: PAS domain-containing sensor histidine kinase [Verrucomicrobia bacterium CG_4_10_14_3_um_filter_43_23]PIY62906.1 MAG: PAS domain-containing sensor histidine kinase [Verrucomicrobia bacterium CG_4_10_14_0_8_um_filter_43_34]PJA43677.1 MAG: PAS domain-containing sen